MEPTCMSGWKEKNPTKMNSIHGIRVTLRWPVYAVRIFYTDPGSNLMESGPKWRCSRDTAPHHDFCFICLKRLEERILVTAMRRFNISHRFPLTTRSTVALTKSESSDVIDDVGITEKDKISFYVIGLFLSTVSLYVIIALAYHRYRTHKRKKKEALLRKSESTRGRKLKGSSSPWLDNLSLIAAVFAFLNCLSDHPTMYTKDVSSLTCKVMQCFSFIFYAAGITSLYTFLWLRQRACYKSPTLAQMYSKLLTVLSSTILPVFLVMMVAGMALTATLWTFEGSEVGCVETSENRVPFIVLFSGSVAMQLTLLGLFVFPLKRHARFVNDSILAATVGALLCKEEKPVRAKNKQLQVDVIDQDVNHAGINWLQPDLRTAMTCRRRHEKQATSRTTGETKDS
ncbi:unnamed protein product [Clavelina lepadiformis]|uniref:G-protein coupled receptors family 3 profile domain-containing protein n=1 Tax=Clavelina lepadiformis TaxID=159417 RepID=A0ABP0EUH6_CLALP